jgi:hypothetical protein
VTPAPEQSIETRVAQSETKIEFIMRALEQQIRVNEAVSNRCGQLELSVATNVIGRGKGADRTWANVVIIVSMALTIISLIVLIMRK